jgi:hypothetical protein
MLTPEDRANVTDIGDRLIDLYTRRAEACGQDDWHRVRRLGNEISEEAANRQSILDRGDSPERL